MKRNSNDLESDLFKEPSAKKDTHIYTVSEITQDIKVILENTFFGVYVEGEVSNLRPSASGHQYFSLKDQQCVLQAVAFSRTAKDIKFKLEDGLKVVCFGNVEVYGPHGKYQLIIERIEPKGIGGLQLALEQLKEKLEKEGLFSPAHKRPIPYLPSKIGIVTSLQGAAIKDILKVLDRRFRDVHVIVNSVRVQGDEAKNEIALAIKEFNVFNKSLPKTERIEVLIVGRGGGSIEDLWAFNEEVVARAIYNSDIPVISAVGHERDVTVSDLVADLRAPTPSVAAELVIPRKEDLDAKLKNYMAGLIKTLSSTITEFQTYQNDMQRRLRINIEHAIELNSNIFESARKKLNLLNPAAMIELYAGKITDLERQINVRISHYIKLREAGFSKLVEGLSNLSPLNILSRGYSITFNASLGSIVKDVSVVKQGDLVKTRLHKGEFFSRVTEVKNNG